MVRKEKKTLAEWLQEQGVISPKVLEEARAKERETGKSLRKILVESGALSEEDMVNFIAQQMGITRIELSNYLIDTKVIDCIPEVLARKYQLIPVLKIGKNVTCAMVDPLNIFALDEIRMKTSFTIEPAVATETEIRKALDEYYGVKGTMEEVIQGLDEKKLGIKEGEEIELKRLEGIAEEPPVVRLVNMMVMEAVRENASDIHIEPEEDSLSIRFRVDGILHEKQSPPKHFQSAIISRIKVLANLDIAERRKPQDGRFHMKMENKQIDIRVSCVPIIHGENVVMRLLDSGSVILGLDQLGFSGEMMEKYKKLLPASPWNYPGHRAYGKRQNNDPLYIIEYTQYSGQEYHHCRRPCGIPSRGVRQIQVNPQADPHFRQWSACYSPSRPGYHHGRRDPGFGKRPRSPSRRVDGGIWSSRRCIPTMPPARLRVFWIWGWNLI